MSTTMFVPMPEWQAILFLRDRRAAFERLLAPLDEKLPCEVSPTDEGTLYGFRSRKDATRFGYERYPEGFAMVRLVIHPLLYGQMALRRSFVGATDADAPGSHLYRVNREGLIILKEKCVNEEAEVMVDQIFTPCVSQSCVTQRQCTHNGSCQHDAETPTAGDSGRPTDNSEKPTDNGGMPTDNTSALGMLRLRLRL